MYKILVINVQFSVMNVLTRAGRVFIIIPANLVTIVLRTIPADILSMYKLKR